MTIFRATLIACLLSLVAPLGIARADGGRMWIYPYEWNGSQQTWYQNAIVGSTEDYPNLPVETIDQMRETLSNGGLLSSDGTDYAQFPPLGLDPREPLPAPNSRVLNHEQALVRAQSGYGSDAGLFARVRFSSQRVVIAWNGYSDGRGRQTLIVDPCEAIECDRDTATLNVTPLPGRPISVEPVSPRLFDELRNNLYGKLGLGYLIEDRFGVTIGPHNVFAWKLHSVEEFQQNVQAYVAEKFEGQGAALITKDTIRTIEYYLEKGFRYFAFDLAIARGNYNMPQYRTPIAYTCVASHGFLPLVTTNYDSPSKSFNVILLSPDTVRINGAIKRLPPDADNRELTSEEARLVGGRNAKIPIAELREISPKLVEVFGGWLDSVVVRNLQFSGNSGGFNKDFTAVNAW